MKTGYRPQWTVELTIPFTRGAAHPSALSRQCDHFKQGHSVNGEIDCYADMDWDDTELDVNLTLKSSLPISKSEAQTEAVDFWNMFSRVWLDRWFQDACGEPTVTTTTRIK